MLKKTYRKTRWGSRTSKLTRAIRSKAPRRYNWYAVDSPCLCPILPFHRCQSSEDFTPNDGVSQIDPDDGSVTGPGLASRVSLFDPEDPGNPGQTQYGDDVTIVRTQGFIQFLPIWAPRHIDRNSGEFQYTCDEVRQIRQSQAYFFRAGLKKDTFITPVEDQLIYVPPYRDPMVPDNWADGRFLKTWQYEKWNTVSMGLHDLCDQDFLAVYGNVTGGALNLVPPIVAGEQIGYDINTVNTTAQVTVDVGDIPADSRFLPGILYPHGEADRSFKIHLNSRRRIRLRESEGLSLWFNYTAPDWLYFLTQGGPRPLHNAAVGFMLRIHLKILLETS